MQVLGVNSAYPFQLPLNEGAIADFLRPAGNRLLIAINNISSAEEKTLRRGELRCGILAKNGAILLLWQFSDKKTPVFTLDSPFDSRLIPDIQLHNVTSAKTQLVIDIHIVDLATGKVKGLRSITMPPGLTVDFLSAVQDQLATSEGADKQLREWMKESPELLTSKVTMWRMGQY